MRRWRFWSRKNSGVFGTVLTENSVRFENAEVPIVGEIMVATTMSSLFVALCSGSLQFPNPCCQAEILALRHQLAVLQKNAPFILLS